MNTIIGYSELLQEKDEDFDQDSLRSDLKKIYSAGTHLGSLISDVMDLSRIEAGNADLHITTFIVKDLLDAVVTVSGQLIEQNNNTLEVNCATGTDTMRSDTGLGLSIARDYCHLLDGELDASSKPGEASVFAATLPADILRARLLAEKHSRVK